MTEEKMLQEHFEETAKEDGVDALGYEKAYALLQKHCGDKQLEDFFVEKGLSKEKTFMWTEFKEIALELGWLKEQQDETLDPDMEETLQEIEERVGMSTFPEVRPTDLADEKKREAAQAVLDLIQKEDKGDPLQSFMNAQWRDHLAENPAQEDDSEQLQRPRWYYECFYEHCQRFILQKARVEGEFGHRMEESRFLPMIPVSTLEEGSYKHNAQEVVDNVQERDLKNITASLKQQWIMWKKVAGYVSNNPRTEEQVFKDFIDAEYFVTIKVVVQARLVESSVPPSFQPTFSPDNNENAIIRASNRALIERAVPADAEAVKVALGKKWQSQMGGLSAAMQATLSEEAVKKFEEEYYFDTLNFVVGEREKAAGVGAYGAVFTFQPQVSPDKNATPEMISVRRGMLKKMTAENVTELERLLVERWNEERDQISPAIRELVPLVAPKKFIEEQYYPFMQETLEEKSVIQFLPSSNYQVPLGLAENDENATEIAFGIRGAMFSVIAGSTVGKGESAPLEFTGARKVLEEAQQGNRCKFEGWILDDILDPRTVSPNDTGKMSRKRSAEVERTVLDVMCADNTGPIMITLWENAVREFVAIIQSNKMSEKKPLVLFEGLRVVELHKTDWHGDVLTNVKILQSLPASAGQAGTKITLSEVPTSPFTTTEQYIPPMAPVAITRFLPYRARMVPPFKGTFVGSIADVREPDVSQQGLQKQLFDLVDELGTWFTCCALGRCAVSPALKSGLQVVLYNGTGRPKSGSAIAAVYLFKDAVMVPLREKSVLKQFHLEM